MKTRIPSVLITFALVCFALVENTQAVSPPPDGGYPGANTAEGQNALLSLTTGGFNTAVGFLSLRSNTMGAFNTAIGAGALLTNIGDPNAFFGEQNTATGAGALLSNTIGNVNTANGAFALFSNTTGTNNTANGSQALLSNTIGNDNTAIGAGTLSNNTTGSANIVLGFGAGSFVTTANNVTCIGAVGANVSNSCYIGNIRGALINGDAYPVYIDSTGRLGTAYSLVGFKKEIQPMDKASEAILSLKPVTFHYKSDAKSTPQFGLIAEEVAEVNSDLVVRDKNGEIYTVRYDAVNAMLLNEFLKAHRKIKEQGAVIAQLKFDAVNQKATISELKKGMETVVARLKEQDSKIQKVSAQLEASTPAPQVVNNP
jgi:hypothetical protein